MKPIRLRIATFIGCVLAVSALTSCSAPDAFTVFNVPQSSVDMLPPGDAFSVIGSIEADTTRLLWTDDSVSYFAALSDGDPCLIILDEVEAASACSTELPVGLAFKDGPEMRLADGPSNSEQNWTEVADHLWISN